MIGIVASRLAERHWRPTILISVEPGGAARGSGRSIPGFDLISALRDCEEYLVVQFPTEHPPFERPAMTLSTAGAYDALYMPR